MVVSCGTETGDGSKGSGALYVSGFDGSFPYITLGVASAFGLDHYILPHITQRIQAASAFQAGPHFISYPGAVPTLSHLQHLELKLVKQSPNRENQPPRLRSMYCIMCG